MEKKPSMKKQIIVLMTVVTMIAICVSPVVSSVTTVTGTFTPIPTGVSIACNQTAPAFGNINLGSNKENLSINITNDGDVSCSVVTTAGQGTGGWTLVAGVASPGTTDEYCINMDPEDAGYLDVYTEQTVASELKPTGSGLYHVKMDLKVFVSSYTTEGSPGIQTFYTNLTAAAIS